MYKNDGLGTEISVCIKLLVFRLRLTCTGANIRFLGIESPVFGHDTITRPCISWLEMKQVKKKTITSFLPEYILLWSRPPLKSVIRNNLIDHPNLNLNSWAPRSTRTHVKHFLVWIKQLMLLNRPNMYYLKWKKKKSANWWC